MIFGQIQTGFTIGLGAVLLAGSPTGAAAIGGSSPSSWRETVLPALLAVLAATAIAGAPLADLALIALAAAVGLLSGYSRPVAGGTIRFIIYLVLSESFLDGAAVYHSDAAFIFGSGALWNILLRTLLVERKSEHSEPQQPQHIPTAAQRRDHFRKSLRRLGGWQFPLRIALGLGIASGLRHLWPSHHFYWILLTIALLTQRPAEHIPVKTVQRLAGTVGGVALTGVILAAISSSLALGIAAGLLAILLPLARGRSYLLYSITITPLILLVLDINKPVDHTLLTDRLIATLAGGLTVIMLNVVFDRLITAEARGRAA